jgi:hypothetical protein
MLPKDEKLAVKFEVLNLYGSRNSHQIVSKVLYQGKLFYGARD